VEIAGQIERQTEVLTSIGGNLDGLGATVQVAVIQGFARALNNADEDGVIPEDSEDHAH
jgi:hypothetical protein